MSITGILRGNAEAHGSTEEAAILEAESAFSNDTGDETYRDRRVKRMRYEILPLDTTKK